MDLLTLMNVALCLVIFAICGMAVFSSFYDDTLTQRIALSGMALGALAVAGWIWNLGWTPTAVTFCIWPAAIFAVSTGAKIRLKVRKGTYVPSTESK